MSRYFKHRTALLKTILLFLLCLATGFSQAQVETEVSGINLRLTHHFPISATYYPDYDYQGITINQDSSALILLFKHSDKPEAKLVFYSYPELAELESIPLKATDGLNNMVDWEYRDSCFIVLAFDKVHLYSIKTFDWNHFQLKHSYNSIHSCSRGLFLSNTYNFQNDSAFRITSFNYSNSNHIKEKTIYEEQNLEGKSASHLRHEWLRIEEDGIFICRPFTLEIRHLNFEGELIKEKLVKHPSFRLPSVDSLNALYHQYPINGKKGAITAMIEELRNFDYLERILSDQNQVLISVNPRLENARVILRLSKEELEILSIDTLYMEMFDNEWKQINGNQYSNSLFPLRLDFNQELLFLDNRLLSILEMNYFPEGQISGDIYLKGFEEYVQKNAIQYSFLIHELK